MKTVAFALLVLACVTTLRADILVNSGFTDGRAHWKGDAQPLDQSDLSSPTTSPGVIITLKKDKWTKIYQVFTTSEKKLRYSVSFKLSSDTVWTLTPRPVPGPFPDARRGWMILTAMFPQHANSRHGDER